MNQLVLATAVIIAAIAATTTAQEAQEAAASERQERQIDVRRSRFQNFGSPRDGGEVSEYCILPKPMNSI